MERIVCVVVGYVFGLLQSGYLYGRTKNMDIRQYGSGNAGSTNVLRVMGKKAGLIVFCGDFFKAVLAMCLARALFKGNPSLDLLALYAGFGVTLGHNFPFYLGFKGGKGIASMAGIMTAMDYRITLTCLVIFAIVVGLTLACLLFMKRMASYALAPAAMPEFFVLAGVLMCMAVWRHRANIKRLLSGTENKVGAKKK